MNLIFALLKQRASQRLQRIGMHRAAAAKMVHDRATVVGDQA